MTEQTLKRFVGALVVVAALWAVTAMLSSDGDSGRAASGDIAVLFDGVSAASVTAVRMSSASGDTELSTSGGAWSVNGFASDSGVVARFWAMITTASVGQLVATNPINHERMSITDADAWTLEFDVAGETRTLLVGADGPQFASSYARLPGSDDVYLLHADARVHMRRQIVEWRNKRLVALDTAVVARVEVERAGDRYVLVRGAESWTFENGDAAAALAIQNLLTDLRGFDTAGVLEDEVIAGADQAGRTVVMNSAGQVLAVLTVGAGEADHWARVEGDDTVYRLPTFRVDRLFPLLDRVIPDEPSGA
ncbi:MAG: DUF4340 domain-containing protein [Longimicrobiales bacterium]